MKRSGKTLLSALCALAFTLGARAAVNESAATPSAENGDSPYSAIWQRNVFDLKAPPAPVAPPAATAPPVNVTLNGITTLLGIKRALLSVHEPQTPGKPPSKEESYILTEGQRQGVLEVLEINSKAGTVKIKNEDLISTITFTTNKVAGGGGLGGGPAPMAGGMPYQPLFTQPPGGNPNPAPPPAPMPTRMLRSDASQPAPVGGYAQSGYGQGGVATTTGASAGLAIPNLFNQASPQQVAPNQPSNLSAEEQVALMLAQKAAFEHGLGTPGNGNTPPGIHQSSSRAPAAFPPMPPLPGQ